MTETTLLLVLLAVAAVVLVVVIVLPDPRRGALVGEAEALVRWSAVAAIAALSTALLYIADAETHSPISLAAGDGMMVLAAAAVWAALSAVNARRYVVPALAAAAAVCSTVVSLLVPETPATVFKLVLVGLACLAFGTETLHGRVHELNGRGLLAGAGFGFGAYLLARALVMATSGTGSVLYLGLFTTAVSTAVSAVAVTAVTTGVILLFRRLIVRPSRSSSPALVRAVAVEVHAQGRALSVYRLDVPGFDLVRDAYGVAACQVMRDALSDAAGATFPTGVFALAPDGAHLVAVEAERRGASSAAPELIRRFEQSIDRAGLADLATVDVVRDLVHDEDHLHRSLATLMPTSRAVEA